MLCENNSKNKASVNWDFFEHTSLLKSSIETILNKNDFSELELNFKYQVNSFNELKTLADYGDQIAQYLIGFCYEKAIGVIQSPKKAFHYYNLSANQGYVKGLYQLAHCYEVGFGCQKSIKKAIHYYEAASSEKPLSSWNSLANIFENGIGCKKSIKKANFYYSKKLNYILNECDLNSSNEQMVVGYYYEKGIGCEKSYEKAFYYYNLAADQGDNCAYICLGDCYAQGLGCEKSIEKSLYYYELAAIHGSEAGYRAIIFLLVEHEPTHPKLFFYLNKAISEKLDWGDSLYAYYEYEIAYCYENGLGCNKSNKNALLYYELSASHGNDLAIQNLKNQFFYRNFNQKRLLKKSKFLQNLKNNTKIDIKVSKKWKELNIGSKYLR